MVDGTRSGRVTRGRAGGVVGGKTRAMKPQGVTKNKPRPPPKRDARPPPKPRAARGRGRQAAAAHIEPTQEQHQEPAPTTGPAEPTPAPPLAPKVTRIYNDLWASTLDSIAFVHQHNLSTTPDTNTITLNLIDHIIKPENWNPDLSYNVLSATCFYFASVVTGLERNTPENIAGAMEVDIGLVEAMAGPQVHYDSVVRSRLAEALRVKPEDVRKGYGILWQQREGLKEFVGGFVKELEGLPELGKPGGEKEEEQADVEEVVEATEKASEVELDDSELDDFDRYVEENE
ncbi:hypothetical protein PRZ48_002452 [Zasmidium cellare]|uniref:Uncharacterized protein n=1 Tax=Zasmidium cellare TaxID=395010 RepID=A0ABR0F5M6_ZASCE|nr:hypothetical protein PRZ48_002452 [Zasmidium cellare]